MRTNYIVNYGVDARHLCESECFETYRGANAFYEGLDKFKWGAGNLVKIEDGPEGPWGPWGPAKVIEKKSYAIR